MSKHDMIREILDVANYPANVRKLCHMTYNQVSNLHYYLMFSR